MAQYVIEILDGDRAGEVVPLPERALRIGRKPGNDIVITDEKTSGSHAEIVPDNGRYLLRDLDSTNGTLMDGRKVTELALTPGDTFVVGRVRMCFRGESDSSRADGSALMVQSVDRSRLGKAKGSRSVGMMLVILVLVGASGGYLWWQRRGGETEGGRRIQAPLVVAGNRLLQTMASCEGEDGWNLRAAGTGLVVGSPGNTGKSALEAVRGDGDADFALARSQQPITVVFGRVLTLSARVRTSGGAKAAVRLCFSAADEHLPVPFRSGTALAGSDDYTEVHCAASVPQGADRVEVELLASLPEAGASAWFDDVALTEGGEATTYDLQIDGGKLLGGSGSITVQSAEPVLLAVEPAVDSGPLVELQKQHLLAVTDQGFSLAASKNDLGFGVVAHGAPALWLLFPGDSSGGVLAGGVDGGFKGVAAASTFTAQQVLLGSGPSRCLLSLPAAVELQGVLGGGIYRLRVPGDRFDLLLNFREQRSAAKAQLGDIRRLADAEPGKALDALRELGTRLPHDDRVLGEARDVRATITGRLQQRLDTLRAEFEEAGFFRTRGGFARVVAGIDDVVQRFGENNLEDAAAVQKLRADASAQLQELDSSRMADKQARLEDLADGLKQAQQPDLEKLVRDYLKRQH